MRIISAFSLFSVVRHSMRIPLISSVAVAIIWLFIALHMNLKSQAIALNKRGYLLILPSSLRKSSFGSIQSFKHLF